MHNILPVLIILVWVFMSTGCGDVYESTAGVEESITNVAPLPTPPATLPELIAALADENPLMRISAAYALGEQGSAAEPAVPALIDNLYYEQSYEVRQSAARALGQIGPAADPAVPHLVEIASSEDEIIHVRVSAAVALGKIGNASAVPALAQLLYDPDSGLSVRAARAIGLITGQPFPDIDKAGSPLEENGIPRIVNAARTWWEQEGQYQEWPGLDTK